MITVSYEQLMIGIGVILFLYLAYDRAASIVGFFKKMKEQQKMHKKYEEKLDEVLKMKEKGEHHEWIDMMITHPVEGRVNTHVCKKTGYAPQLESFVSLESVKRVIKSREEEEEFQKYKEKKLEEYSSQYGIEDAKTVYEKMITIKKDFHVKKMENFQKEMKEKYGKNVTVINDVSELEELFKDLGKK